MNSLLDRIAPVLTFNESGFSNGEERWSAKLLYEEAKRQGCRSEKFYLKFVDFTEHVFRGERLADSIFHARRVMNADLSIPIIVSPLGSILDGYHRIAKAVLDGESHVMCYRLKEMPAPDGKDGE